MTTKCVFPILAALFLISLSLSGCGKSDSTTTAAGSASAGPTVPGFTGAAGASPLEQEAQNAALAEIQKHFVKNADGWITARITGSPYSPEHFLRQVREILVDHVATDTPSDSDKLNGVEWSGQVIFKQLACREAGDSGMLLEGMGDITPNRQHGQWTAWAEYQPEVLQLQKIKGQWQVDTNTWILRGTTPTPADFSAAGVTK